MNKSLGNIIEITNLVKNFGQTVALDSLDLTVKKGEVHGFLGPNGSGKSTTIRILLGLLKKTSGDISLFGQDPWKNAVELHKRLAYVPGEVSFWAGLSGGEIIDLLGSLRGGLDEKRRAELLEKFELDATKKFRTYSKGNRQKVALIAALASDVELYILDEPTSGLDPLMESVFQDEIKAIKKQNKTVLLSSHILAEVEALCDHITIIRNGKTVESDTLIDIRKKHRLIISIETKDELEELASIKGVQALRRDNGNIHFELDNENMNKVLSYLSKHNITNLTSHPPKLEDLFLSHYDSNEK